MFNKLNVLLFKPRYIARFIADSYAKIFFFLFIFIFIITGVKFLNNSVNSRLGQQNENLIINHIVSNLDESYLSFYDNTLETYTNFSFILGNALIRIGFDEVDRRTTNVVFNFMSEKVVIVYFGAYQITHYYSDLNMRNFDFENISNGVFEDRMNLISFMNVIFNNFMVSYRPFLFFINFFTVVYSVFFMIFLVYLFSWRYGRHVRGSYRTKIILYSSTWILFMMLFQHLFLLNQLMYLGLIISLIFAQKCLSNIIKIKTYRN